VKSIADSVNCCLRICFGLKSGDKGTRARCPRRTTYVGCESRSPCSHQSRRCASILKRFSEVYERLGKTDSILAAAPAHHRLVWIHPFLDGNGRVARLMSHATFLEALDTGAIWSVARGLARNEVGNYKEHLAASDAPRRNDLDGRGNLSEEALAAFTEFFLKVCIDQVSFMEKLMQPQELRGRILFVGRRGNQTQKSTHQIQARTRSPSLSWWRDAPR